VYAVYFNKKRLGAFVIQDDGYFGFYPDDLKGYWSSHALRLIADKLDETNTAWDEYINKNLK
jgi:S-formylglutathione hydrolase FrmB